jgi:hypothetical protein
LSGPLDKAPESGPPGPGCASLGSGLDPPSPPCQTADPRARIPPQSGPPGPEFLRIFGPCGATFWGGGGAPPTTLILLRNQCARALEVPCTRRAGTSASPGRSGAPGGPVGSKKPAKKQEFFFFVVVESCGREVCRLGCVAIAARCVPRPGSAIAPPGRAQIAEVPDGTG